MRLSDYPFVRVLIACKRCHRRGSYRLARLSDRYGAEIALLDLIAMLSADCKLREQRNASIYERCEAFFPDLADPRPPDEPTTSLPPKLRVVKR